mgnify:CR=1 FL=1
MDTPFWRKITGGIALGGALGSIVPAAATVYFWKLESKVEVPAQPQSTDTSDAEEAKPAQKPVQKGRKRAYSSPKAETSYQSTTPRKRDTEADQLADTIMGYIEMRKTSPEPNFQSYHNYVAETGRTVREMPREFYQNDRHYLLGEERFVEELYYGFRSEHFGGIELLLPTAEDGFSQDFRRRMAEEIADQYGL